MWCTSSASRASVARAVRFFSGAALLAALLLGAPAPSRAQEATPPASSDADSLGVWDVSLSAKFSGSQAAYSNWTEGGISTLALTAGIGGKANRVTRHFEQTYDLRLSFGVLQQGDRALRKTDDLIKLGAALQYEGEGFFRLFNPTVAATARSQFAAGFNYDEAPPELAPDGAPAPDPPVKVSDFMNPGVFEQTLGLTYDPRPWFTQRVGLASKQTVVTIERLRPVYGLDPGSPARVEAGLSSMTEFDRRVFENVRYQSTLGLFYAVSGTDEWPDATFENIVAMQVNDWLGVDFELTTLYDRDISDELQVKEILSVGVTFVFL
ncbi:MAG: hypothetical protein BRD52_07580 [Bacteroidetes bacterium SW_4_67_19]|jgi:hypothetical protein|nr:MAG: hypothetical protein BRD52_07580 [Bacteroidetes bacterium SW_4_67_19]